MKRRVPAILMTSALAIGGLAATAPAASAQAAPGETSLAGALTADGDQFDRNAQDFDIVTEAALAIVGAKPDSPVALPADGTQRLTVRLSVSRCGRAARSCRGGRASSRAR